MQQNFDGNRIPPTTDLNAKGYFMRKTLLTALLLAASAIPAAAATTTCGTQASFLADAPR